MVALAACQLFISTPGRSRAFISIYLGGLDVGAAESEACHSKGQHKINKPGELKQLSTLTTVSVHHTVRGGEECEF